MGECYASLIVGVAFGVHDDLGRAVSETMHKAGIYQKTGITFAGKQFRVFEDERHNFPKAYALGYEIATTGRWDTHYSEKPFEMTPELLASAGTFVAPAKAALKELGQDSLCNIVGIFVVEGHT
jgi:hypothetical protein